MASIIKNELSNGDISYKIQVKILDPITNKAKFISKTWRKPPDTSEIKADKEVKGIAYNFEQQVKNGDYQTEKQFMTFKDYSDIWLQRCKATNSPTYHSNATKVLKIINSKFGHIQLRKINQQLIQNYFNELDKVEIVDNKAVLAKPINDITKRFNSRKLADDNGFSKTSILYAKRGYKVEIKTAELLAKAYEFKMGEYFDIIKTTRQMAKESKLKHKRIISAVLGSAVKEGIIKVNYAQAMYLQKITGPEYETKLLHFEEIKKLLQYLDNKVELKKRSAILILVHMGLRIGELLGLEWQDIDFEKNTMKIERSSAYVDGKLITKAPKSKNSKRTLRMTNKVNLTLQEYKKYWDDMSNIPGNNYKVQNRLFAEWNTGNSLFRNTIDLWFKKILEECSLPRVNLHSLRHSNLSILIKNNTPVHIVSAFAGHHKPSVTLNIYTHIMKGDPELAAENLNKAFDFENNDENKANNDMNNNNENNDNNNIF